mmetsp:Transcript_25825/g.49035  ORF Transcript_25825/g.49035 Transcript_25825/m.49035 type:complete len:361 (+) Transcript_25825:241-1323(+)
MVDSNHIAMVKRKYTRAQSMWSKDVLQRETCTPSSGSCTNTLPPHLPRHQRPQKTMLVLIIRLLRGCSLNWEHSRNYGLKMHPRKENRADGIERIHSSSPVIAKALFFTAATAFAASISSSYTSSITASRVSATRTSWSTLSFLVSCCKDSSATAVAAQICSSFTLSLSTSLLPSPPPATTNSSSAAPSPIMASALTTQLCAASCNSSFSWMMSSSAARAISSVVTAESSVTLAFSDLNTSASWSHKGASSSSHCISLTPDTKASMASYTPSLAGDSSIASTSCTVWSRFSFTTRHRMVAHTISTQSTHNTLCCGGMTAYVMMCTNGHSFHPAFMRRTKLALMSSVTATGLSPRPSPTAM